MCRVVPWLRRFPLGLFSIGADCTGLKAGRRRCLGSSNLSHQADVGLGYAMVGNERAGWK